MRTKLLLGTRKAYSKTPRGMAPKVERLRSASSCGGMQKLWYLKWRQTEVDGG